MIERERKNNEGVDFHVDISLIANKEREKKIRECLRWKIQEHSKCRPVGDRKRIWSVSTLHICFTALILMSRDFMQEIRTHTNKQKNIYIFKEREMTCFTL